MGWIALLLLFPVRPWLSKAWQSLAGRRRDRWATVSLVLGGLLALAIPVETGRNTESLALIYTVSAFVAWSALFGALLLVTGAWLMFRPAPSADPDGALFGRWEWLALAAPPLAVWTAYLLAYWPGV